MWRSSTWGVMPVMNSGARVWDWVKFLWSMESRGVVVKELFLYASIVVDTIWKTRNDKVHNNSSCNIKHCIDYISMCYADYGSCLFPAPMTVESPIWSPPRKLVKINCNVKVVCDSMCVVALARDYKESVLWIATNVLNFSNSVISRGLSVSYGISSLLEAFLYVDRE
uniref:Uncharacterized protein n=1 Tax=Cannabis sativa TaxID=3483 RepID=A0A803Q0V3_CANSA